METSKRTGAGELFKLHSESTSLAFRGKVEAVFRRSKGVLEDAKPIMIPIYKAPVLVFMALHFFLSQEDGEVELLDMRQDQIARSFTRSVDGKVSIGFDPLEDLKVVLDLERREPNEAIRVNLGFGSDWFGWFCYKADTDLYRRLGEGLENLLDVDKKNHGLICIAWARWYCTRNKLEPDDPDVFWPLAQERRTALKNLLKKHREALDLRPSQDVNSTRRTRVPSDSDSDSDSDDDVPHHPHRAETFSQARESRRSASRHAGGGVPDSAGRPPAHSADAHVPSDSFAYAPPYPDDAYMSQYPSGYNYGQPDPTAYYTSPLANPSARHPDPAYAEGPSSAAYASYRSPTSSRRQQRRRDSVPSWQDDIPTRHRSDR
ncbi:hypothetical protein JCM1840_000269 [Sporobolomyces johnsonii]